MARYLYKKTILKEVQGDTMFIIILKFSENKEQSNQFMEGHNEWIKQGFADNIFLMVGSLQPNLGGAVIAHNITHTELQNRVNEDPFVAEKIVQADIIEITPSKTDQRLDFLHADGASQ